VASVVIDVLRQVCLLREGLITEITGEGAFARVNAEVIHKVVPLAEDILLACARCVNALQENDTSLGIWVLELICFIAYFPDLVL
jgi:hypothetical protein